MIAPNHNLLCKQAEPYYYDLLCDESHPLIPESVVNHTEQCQDCREQINKLKAALSQADTLESERGQVRSAVTAMLKLHFDYIGKPVTCNIVKPFLPCLLDPALEIRIPTPTTTHLLNCQQCSGDLDMIRCLNLNRKQLCRLSQMFAEKPTGDNIGCSKARNAIPSVVSMVFSEIDSEVLKHLCKCPVCRELLYKERQKICESLPEDAPSPEFPCESVSTTDIFDYAVPYGIAPANDQYAKFRKSFTSHAATCPNCLAKMQELHKTIYHYIAERAESDVVTVYHVDESAKAEARSESDDIYAGFPIRVETANREDEVNTGRLASTIGFVAALKQRVSAMKIKPLAKAAVATAAVVLIAAALFLSTQTAKAVTIDQIYKAIEKVKNVHISRYVPDKKEPIQEKWVSRALNIYMMKTGKLLILSDVHNGVRKSKQLDIALTETRPLTNDEFADVENKMRGSLGLTPFYNVSEIPEDAEWGRVTNDGLEGVSEGIEVYDLTWLKKAYGDPVVGYKWRFFVDPETKLPQKTKFYEKLPADSDYTLTSVIVIEYLSNSEILAVIKDAGFSQPRFTPAAKGARD